MEPKFQMLPVSLLEMFSNVQCAIQQQQPRSDDIFLAITLTPHYQCGGLLSAAFSSEI